MSNNLAVKDREALFGIEFSEAIDGMDEYVVAYTTGFDDRSIDAIHTQEYTPRKVGYKFHATLVIEPRFFVKMTIQHWAAYVVRMANFAQQLHPHNST